MELRDKIKLSLRESYGDFSSYLEHEYERKLTENLATGNIMQDSDKARIRAWLTYNQVILEFKNTLKDMPRVKELQYRLTDKEDPNQVCIQVIESLEERSPELERLYNKIINFSGGIQKNSF